jgi:hypothetical protein
MVATGVLAWATTPSRAQLLTCGTNALDVWQGQVSGVSVPLSDVAFGNGAFVATSGFFDSSNGVVVSSDGINWTNYTGALSVCPYRLMFTNGVFIGGGKSGSITTSTNGRDWQETNCGLSSAITGIARFRDTYLVVSQRLGVAASQDGQNWTVMRAEMPNLDGGFITCDDKQVLLVSGAGLVYSSTNAVDWSLHNQYPRFHFLGIQVFNGKTIAVGGLEIRVMREDYSWQFVAQHTAVLWSLKSENGVLLATGLDGSVLTSLDGTNWTRRSTPAGGPLRSAGYGNGRFVAVGDSGRIVTSELNSPALRLSFASDSGPVIVEATTYPGTAFTVQRSTNLIDWSSVGTIPVSSGIGQFADEALANAKVYRIVPE